MRPPSPDFKNSGSNFNPQSTKNLLETALFFCLPFSNVSYKLQINPSIVLVFSDMLWNNYSDQDYNLQSVRFHLLDP